MAVKSVGPKVNQNYSASNFKDARNFSHNNSQVSFQGSPVPALKAPNVIVKLMEFIAAGGFAASFIIQDGLGFIAPRVGKGLLRGGKVKKDENGNVVLDKNGNPKHEFNWAYARKEGVREVITGPSAFVIPWLALKGINKFGKANSVKLNYIDGFKNEFTKYAQNNIEQIINGTPDKTQFYEGVFRNIIESTINSDANSVKMSVQEIEATAKNYAKKQIEIDEILSDKTISKAERKAKLSELGSIEDDFMLLKKQHIGGKTNEMLALFNTSDGKIQGGGIKEITNALRNYFDDATKTVKKVITKNSNADVSEIIKKFTNSRMGSRIFTNLGMFFAVAAFYTQIPKLYNMGLKGNPALGENNEEPSLQKPANKKDVNFTGNYVDILEGTGKKVFNNKKAKSISDIFELNGPIIQGSAMSVLLYTFCIPPRLLHAQDKYDYQEIVVRDFTAFTALLFGAKALGRLFSDGFTKITGLALNDKNLKGRSVLQKVGDYMNPMEGRHSVLSSKQLNSKYTNLHDYKDGVNGFMEFIEQSGGNIKKAFAIDTNVKAAVEKILGKPYNSATSEEIKTALGNAHRNNSKEIKEFYNLFTKENGLLNRAKTCNSAFGFISTLLLVPGLIIALTDYCKYMTEKHKAKDDAQKLENINQILQTPVIASSRPTMAGFLNK